MPTNSSYWKKIAAAALALSAATVGAERQPREALPPSAVEGRDGLAPEANALLSSGQATEVGIGGTIDVAALVESPAEAIDEDEPALDAFSAVRSLEERALKKDKRRKKRGKGKNGRRGKSGKGGKKSGKSGKGSKRGKRSKRSKAQFIYYRDDDPTLSPTLAPTLLPTINPTTDDDENPTLAPTLSPTLLPTLLPTLYPTTDDDDENPTLAPTLSPTLNPTLLPTLYPTLYPTTVDFIGLGKAGKTKGGKARCGKGGKTKGGKGGSRTSRDDDEYYYYYYDDDTSKSSKARNYDDDEYYYYDDYDCSEDYYYFSRDERCSIQDRRDCCRGVQYNAGGYDGRDVRRCRDLGCNIRDCPRFRDDRAGETQDYMSMPLVSEESGES